MAQLSTKLSWDLANTRWASQLNPILALPQLANSQVDSIVLTANKPLAIYHNLGRTPMAWQVVDIQANAVVWRTQPLNSTTITLEASANCTISINLY